MSILPFFLLIAGGFIGGFFGSAVGSAGLVSLPLLILLGFSPHAAIATSRPAAVVLELVSAIRYWREGKVQSAELQKGILLGLCGAAGAIAGAFFINAVSDDLLRLLLALVMSSVIILLFIKNSWGVREQPKLQKYTVLLAISTIFAGLYGGFFGFTFGTLMTVILVLFGHTLLQSAVLSRIIGVFTSLSATIVFIFLGGIQYPYAIALSIGFGLGAWIGAGASVRKGSSYIKKILLVVVVVSIFKLIFDYVSAG